MCVYVRHRRARFAGCSVNACGTDVRRGLCQWQKDVQVSACRRPREMQSRLR